MGWLYEKRGIMCFALVEYMTPILVISNREWNIVVLF